MFPFTVDWGVGAGRAAPASGLARSGVPGRASPAGDGEWGAWRLVPDPGRV